MPEPVIGSRPVETALSAELHPIVPGFHPDPTICRVGDDYYLAHSSFEYFPGAPIFHSRDLVTWTQIGNILSRRSQFRAGESGPSTGIYGSTLRHRDGRYWFITTNVSDFDAGQLIVHATDPAGPWSDPVFVPEAIGIDPDLCWDEDGTCYLTWHVLDFTVGGQGIRQAPIDLGTGRLLEPHYPVWQGSGMPMAEGPHLYQIGDYWYIMLAEGGTERGHCVTIARGPSPRGPFESCSWNPIFTHRSSSHPVQNVGHADLVQTPDGTWAAVYLGARPRGSTPGFHVLGRETFLAGVDWVDDWPVFDEARFEIPEAGTGFAEDFTTSVLDPRWVVADSEPDAVIERVAGGGLRFRSWGSAADVLCTRVTDFAWQADAVVQGSGTVGLRLDDRHWCGVIFEDGHAQAIVQIGDVRQRIGRVEIAGDTAILRISTMPPQVAPVPFGYAGPDDVALSVVRDGEVTEIARLDGRYFSTEVAAGFTGRMLALGAPTTDGRVLSVTYRPLPD
ncbi:glycoside hydrolase family 43 protein [Microbacterium atlanticum]|uniref:glycoside hydrolase family 43 protein n=1 Tax=Microbacterium atlanticum TaxID=2782168 RepID=UPI001887490E|nr:glycoside hydrolase family 43 protein [Microbacterium atlanticum]